MADIAAASQAQGNAPASNSPASSASDGVALGELSRLGLLRPYLRQQLISELVDGDPEPFSNEDTQGAFQAFAQERQITSQEALERITRQFLLFAGSGSKEPFVEVPLDALLEELSGRYDTGLVELELEDVTASVQPVALGRAIANLIDNAIAYGLPPVRVQLLCTPHHHFMIHVVDGGPGIPEHLFSKAVEPFQRLDPARRGEGHCGLGLAIAQRIAHQHGGRLELSRPPDCGGLGLCVSFSGRCQPLGSAPATGLGGA